LHPHTNPTKDTKDTKDTIVRSMGFSKKEALGDNNDA
jgi:hypothetical protein